MNFFQFTAGCDHTQQPLQRRPVPKQEFKIGLPGIGTVISAGRNPQGGYTYYCPGCQKTLPPFENARWEALYAKGQRPITTRPLSGGSAKPRIKAGATKRSGGISHNQEPIGAKLRYDILTRDKYRCVKCGATKEQVRLHVDHIIPRKHGGSNAPSNLQTLCEKCNLGKGARYG